MFRLIWIRARMALLCRRARYPLAVLLAVLALGAAEPEAPATASSPVRLGDDTVFSLAAEHRGKSPGARATQSSQTLEQLARASELPEVRVELSAGGALVAAGSTQIIELSAEDARLAGDANLEAYASKTAGAIRQALEAEHKRGQIAGTVFSFSLLVFFALIAFYLIKKVASLGDRSRVWLEEHGDRVLTVSVKNIELVRPAMLKSSALILLSLLKLVGQFGIFYAWLVIVLSLFESTRGYTERLTGFVLTPLSLLLGRAVSALPLLVVAGFAALAVLTLVRFVGLFLASVARRETFISWLPADLAAPASVLVRGAIVLAALVFAAPIVTGSTDSSIGRSGTILLIAIGLAATPLFASAVLGSCILFGRRLTVGEYIEVRGRLGRISSINLLELRLDTADQTEHRVPHLLLFISALERLGSAPRFSVEVLVPARAAPALVLEVLTRAGGVTGRNAGAELIGVEPAGARYRVTATCSSLNGRSPLFVSVLEALADAGLGAGELGARRLRRRQPEPGAPMSAIGLLLGLLVLSYLGGMLRGARAIRGFGLPSGSEYLCLGFVFGSQVLDLIPLPLLQSFRPLLLVGAAWIAFVEGLGYTRVGDRAISVGNAVLGVLGAALVGAAVGAAVWFAVPHFQAAAGQDRILLAGGIAVVSCASTRQAVRWAMLRYAAKGPLSDTLAAFCRASTLVPVIGVSLLLARAGEAGLADVGLLVRVSLTWGIGGVLGLVAVLLIGRGLTRDEVWGVLVGTSLLSIGIAAELGLSSLASAFALGLTIGSLSSRRKEVLGMVRGTERPVLLPLAVLAGALVNLRAAPMLFVLIPLVLSVRALAELARGAILTLVSKAARPAGSLVGLAMMSMGEVTLACAASLALSLDSAATKSVLAVGVVGVLAGEIVGPLALRRALGRAGELDAGAPEPERLSLDPGGSEA